MTELVLAVASPAAVRHACTHWHYAGHVPFGKRVAYGVWEDDSFRGVIVFGRGASAPLYRSWGLRPTQLVELVRVALREHEVEVSRMLAIAIRLLRRSNPGLRLVVSFADPAHGHHGGIYQAAGWAYVGTSGPAREFFIDGRWYQARAAVVRCRVLGITTRDVPSRRVPGKHRYALALDDTMRHAVDLRREPYPRPTSREDPGTPAGPRRFDSDPAASHEPA